jgi:type I restriction enzyme S subunit
METIQATSRIHKADGDKAKIYWLSEIPQTWAILKLKFIAKIYNGDSLNDQQKDSFSNGGSLGLPYVSTKDIDLDTSQIQYENGLRISRENKELKKATPFSFLLCIEGGSAGKKIAYLNREVFFVNKLACFKLKSGFDPKYYYYYLKSDGFQTQFAMSMTGLIGGVAISLIKNFDAYVPPILEQTKIANFLDREISKVERVIAQKNQLIELLNERGRILVNEVVTKGIRPNVTMTDSGIEWIEKIPQDWSLRRVKYLFEQSRLLPKKNAEIVTAFRDGQVTLRSNRRTEGFTIAVLEHGYQGVKKGQLVLNSMDAFEGAIGVSDSDGKCTPEYVVCNPKNGANPYYYSYLLREMALAKYIPVICSAVRERAIRIRYSNLADLFLPVPSDEEQRKIVAFIEESKRKLNVLIQYQERQIEKLKEYKATLINSAVTGKIKV